MSSEPTDSLDDFSDVTGFKNLYDQCVQLKLKGESNGALRSLLLRNGLSEEETRQWIRQIDSDYLEGKLGKEKFNFAKALAPIFGFVLLFSGMWLLLIQLRTGMTSLILTFFGFGLASMGIGLLSYRLYRKMQSATEQARSRSEYSRWKNR